MFPTSSYFKGFNCPFFLSGLCERPYCHYKHGAADTGYAGSSTVSASNREETRARYKAQVPERTGQPSEYVPTSIPVLDQLRGPASHPTQPTHHDPKLQATTASSSAPTISGLSESRPAKRSLGDVASIFGLGHQENALPSKAARLEEPKSSQPSISPFDYLKNIIEGRKPNQSVCFASPAPSSNDSNSDSNSPVKSRLMPPVEADYAPSFCISKSSPNEADPSKSVNVRDKETHEKEKKAADGVEEGGNDESDDEDDSVDREKGDINEVIKKELEKLKELRRQIDPKSLKELQEHLKPLMTAPSGSQSEVSEENKTEEKSIDQVESDNSTPAQADPKEQKIVRKLSSESNGETSKVDEKKADVTATPDKLSNTVTFESKNISPKPATPALCSKNIESDATSIEVNVPSNSKHKQECVKVSDSQTSASKSASERKIMNSGKEHETMRPLSLHNIPKIKKLQPSGTAESKYDSSAEKKDELERRKSTPGSAEKLKENFSTAFKSKNDEVPDFNLSTSFESDDSISELPAEEPSPPIDRKDSRKSKVEKGEKISKTEKLSKKVSANDVISLPDEDSELNDSHPAKKINKEAVRSNASLSGNIFQRFSTKLPEQKSEIKNSQKKVDLKSDNIFARMSNLASNTDTYEDNEYVPTYVNPKKQNASKMEYNPSISDSKVDAEYVPRFLNVKSAAEASQKEYNPAHLVDLTTSPTKDKHKVTLPESSDDDDDSFSPSVSTKKVTRSREFIRKSPKRISSDEDFQVKKKKKKKKKHIEEVEYVKKVKKAKKKSKENLSKKVDSQDLLQSLFGDTLEDLNETSSKYLSSHDLCEPSGSGKPTKPIARPGTSAQSDVDVERKRGSTSYFDPLKQKWYRNDGSEDVSRTLATSKAASSSGAKPQSLAASATSSNVIMKKKSGFVPINAKEMMNQRIQWYEQMKLNNPKKETKESQKQIHLQDTNKDAKASTSRQVSTKQDDLCEPLSKAKITGAKRPTMPRQLGNKLPLEVRKRYLEVFIDECLRIYDVDTDAYERALNEEQAAYDRSSNRTVYLNVVINIRKRLMREQQAINALESGDGTRQERQTISHQAMLGGPLAAKGNFGIGSGATKALDDAMNALLASDGFYDKLDAFCLTEDQLVENGFPIAIGGGNVDIPNADEKMKRSVGKLINERICARCGTNFMIDEDGAPIKKGECYYHWGKLWKRRVAGQGIEQRYTCCSSDTSVSSCELALQHVHEANRYCDLTRYKRAPDLASTKSRRSAPKGVYAVDCEMIYTTKGSELARVTVVDRYCKVVYEQLVLPEGDIVDCNTRFSGLKPLDFDRDDLQSLHQVQRDLRRLFNSETILMGHSLESDLIALKMCHEKVIDTSVVFPHKQGLPYKRALKTLALEFLQKIIQSDVGGHDSKEDAATCMELMLMKVKDDLRKDRRNARS